MKRIVKLSFAALAGVLALAACKKEEAKIEIPAVITANFDNLGKADFVQGTPNQIKLTASSTDATLSITVFTDKVYLEDASFTVGSAAGNYAMHYKDTYVDNDVVSGSLSVTSDEDFNYTVTGTVKLDNEEGTAVKLTATGHFEFELPAEYCYVQSKNGDAVVYDIYTLGDTNEHLAKATVYGGETGKFEVNGTKESGSALYGCHADEGCFASFGEDGYFMQFSGTVEIKKKSGLIAVDFKGPREISFPNCKKVDKVNVPSAVVPNFTAESAAVIKAYSVPSQIVKGAYELTAKVFIDGNETSCVTQLAGYEGPAVDANTVAVIKGFDAYLAITSVEAGTTPIGIGPGCYYTLDGSHVAPPMDGTIYSQIWMRSDYVGISSMLTTNMALIDDVFNWLVAKGHPYALYGAEMAPYCFMGYAML